MFRWLAGRGARKQTVQRTLASITQAQWQGVTAQYPFLVGMGSDETALLRERSAWILASKQFSAAGGMVLDDDMLLAIAVQAALPILHLDTVLYEGWTEIIIYPGGFLIPTVDIDESGVVHEYVQEASGEAWEGGPVCLSWDDIADAGVAPMNVVIHEFAHKLDLYAGDANGMPSLSAHRELSSRQWRQVMESAYNRFVEAVERAEDAVPPDVDPESEAGKSWFGHLPLDPYGATDHAEFFAVSSEAFFVHPGPLARMLPDWYQILLRYYRQDPLSRQHSVRV